MQAELFELKDKMPDRFVYRDEFISKAEEEQLVVAIRELAFSEVKMHGVAAKRRTVHFGRSYEFQTFKLGDAPPIPEFLLTLRGRTGSHRRAAGRVNRSRACSAWTLHFVDRCRRSGSG